MIVKEDKRFNEKVYIMKLNNGMEVHMLPKDDPYFSTYVELSLPFGSNHLTYEQDKKMIEYPAGSAHFMEHKIFAMPYGDAFMKFSNLGVDANAMTSYEQTSYLFSATNHLEEALTLLLEMLDTTYFTKENIETEEQIIAEELKMYLDDIESEIYQDLMTSLYKHYPFKWDIGGTLDSIKKIDEKVLLDIYDKFYHPANRLIVIAGKIDIERMEAYFNAYDKDEKKEMPKIIYPDEPKEVCCQEVIKIKDVSIPKLALGFKFSMDNISGETQTKREMVYTLLFNLLLGSSSDLYHDLLEQQLINKNFNVSSTFDDQFAHFVIFGDTKNPEYLKSHILEQFKQGFDKLITKEAFDRYLKVYIGQFIFALNSVDHKAYLYSRYIHKHVHLFDLIDLIQSIQYEDLIDAYENILKTPTASVIYKKD